MLISRRFKAILVISLVVLVIFTVAPYANSNISNKSGTWRNVFWKVSTGKHSLNSNSANSWHRVFVTNDSIYGIAVDFGWTHELLDDLNALVETDSSSGSFELAARTADRLESHERVGWMGPNTSGLDADDYKIRSTTEITIVNTLAHHTTRDVIRTSGLLALD